MLQSKKNKEIEMVFGGRVFSFVLVPIVSEGCVNVYGTDVTDRKKEELGVKRLSDIGSLAATVAHELRNPLGVIKLAAYNIKKKDQKGLFSENIANIEKTIIDSEQIIDNLLFYSRIKKPSFKKINPIPFLKKSISQSQEKFKEWKVKIKNNFSNFKNISLIGDPAQLREVFANLLNNAFEALDKKKGIIEIKCKYVRRKSEFIINIKDNGIGIDPADLSEIFSPFFSRKASGTGLGLAVCQQIILLHGGKIDVLSQIGRGSSFIVHLPVFRPTR